MNKEKNKKKIKNTETKKNNNKSSRKNINLKKNKKKDFFKNPKELLGGLIIIVLLLLVLVTYIMCYTYKKTKGDKNLNIIDNSLSFINIYDNYTASKTTDKNSHDNSKNIIGTYNCKNDDCDIYSNNLFDSIYDEKYIFIKENGKVFIYNYIEKEIISNLYDDITIKLESNNYIVKKGNKYGMIDKIGTEITPCNYEDILFDDISNNKVKITKNGLYGILDTETGIVTIEPNYSNVNIDSSSNYSVLINNLWYVIDEENNILTNGYNYTFAFSKGFIARIENNLSILKYNKDNAELLNETLIPISNVESNYKIERKGSIIYIEVYNGSTTEKYEYNINRNSLKTIK